MRKHGASKRREQWKRAPAKSRSDGAVHEAINCNVHKRGASIMPADLMETCARKVAKGYLGFFILINSSTEMGFCGKIGEFRVYEIVSRIDNFG